MTEPIKQEAAIVPSKKAAYLDTVEADSALAPTTLGGMMRLAEVISAAGLCPKHLKGDAGSTMLVMAAAQQLGLPWFTGLQKAYVIDGKVAFEAVVLMACAKRSKNCKTLYLEEVTDDKATMVVQTYDMPEPKRVSYTFAEAQKAGLTGKGPWNSYRRNMLVARVATNVSRWYFQEETLGIFTKEELEEGAVLAPASPKDVTPRAASAKEALDRIAPPPVEPEVVVAEVVPPPAPAPRKAKSEALKAEMKTLTTELTGKAKLWNDLATKLLGNSGPGIVATFVKSRLGGKSLDSLTTDEEDKLETYINETAMANQQAEANSELF